MMEGMYTKNRSSQMYLEGVSEIRYKYILEQSLLLDVSQTDCRGLI